MKRVTLELGGKGPHDADLDHAIPVVVAAGFMNSGQACIAGTRILVPEGRMDDVLARLRTEVAAVRVGDPNDPEVSVGPMVSRKQWDRVQSYLKLGQEEGATVLVGGAGRPEGLDHGWFVRPTVFAGVTNNMRIAREEIFGPVLSVIGYATEDEAIAIANDTTYGLQSYVLSSDPERARGVASRLEGSKSISSGTGPLASVHYRDADIRPTAARQLS